MLNLEKSMSRRPICPETGDCELDAALAASFPASDPVAALEPAGARPGPGRPPRRARARSSSAPPRAAGPPGAPAPPRPAAARLRMRERERSCSSTRRMEEKP